MAPQPCFLRHILDQAGHVEPANFYTLPPFTPDFTAFGVDGSLNIYGTCTLMDEEAEGGGRVRVFVEFAGFKLEWGSISFEVPLTWIKPTGWSGASRIEVAALLTSAPLTIVPRPGESCPQTADPPLCSVAHDTQGGWQPRTWTRPASV